MAFNDATYDAAETARLFTDLVTHGGVPSEATADILGPYAEHYQALCKAHETGGTVSLAGLTQTSQCHGPTVRYLLYTRRYSRWENRR